MLAHDPEYVQLDGAARERARRGARFFGVFLFLVGVAGLCAVLIDALGPDKSVSKRKWSPEQQHYVQRMCVDELAAQFEAVASLPAVSNFHVCPQDIVGSETA